jgi:hypothetical protein
VLLVVIVVCEVLFWVLVLAGLVTRYLLGRPRAGAALLAGAPLVDLLLLGATVADLRDGGTATTAHALAGVYIGVSVGFGHAMVRWADERFAHRFAGGPAPRRAPRSGRAHAAHERRGLLRHLVAYGVGAGLLGLGVLVVGDPARTEALTQLIGLWTLVLAVDAVISLSYTVRPRRDPAVGAAD